MSKDYQPTIDELVLKNSLLFGGRITAPKDSKTKLPLYVLSKQDVYEHICKVSKLVLVGEEMVGTPGHHIHVAFCVKQVKQDNKLTTERTVKDWFAEYMRKLLPDLVGNPCVSSSYARANKQLIKYTSKGGLILFTGLSNEFVKRMYQCSTDNDQYMFKRMRDSFEESYFMDRITFRRFQIEILKLYPRFGKNIYTNHLKAYFNRMYLGRDPSDEMCESFLEATKMDFNCG